MWKLQLRCLTVSLQGQTANQAQFLLLTFNLFVSTLTCLRTISFTCSRVKILLKIHHDLGKIVINLLVMVVLELRLHVITISGMLVVLAWIHLDIQFPIFLYTGIQMWRDVSFTIFTVISM